jgi:hypothetical protein
VLNTPPLLKLAQLKPVNLSPPVRESPEAIVVVALPVTAREVAVAFTAVSDVVYSYDVVALVALKPEAKNEVEVPADAEKRVVERLVVVAEVAVSETAYALVVVALVVVLLVVMRLAR